MTYYVRYIKGGKSYDSLHFPTKAEADQACADVRRMGYGAFVMYNHTQKVA